MWPHDGLSTADEEHAPGPQRLDETLENAVLGRLGEVNDDVPTRDQVERTRRVFITQQVVLGEANHAPQRGTDRVPTIRLGDEPALHARAADVANVGGQVARARFGPIDDGLIHVSRQDPVLAARSELV